MDPKKARTVRVHERDKSALTKEIDSKILIWERRATASLMEKNLQINGNPNSSPNLQNTSKGNRLEHHPNVNYSKTESKLVHEITQKKEGDNPKRLNHDECMLIEKELRRLYNFSQIQNDKLKEKIGQLNQELRDEREKNKLLQQEIEQLKARIMELEKEVSTKKNLSTSPPNGNSAHLESSDSDSEGNNNTTEHPLDDHAQKPKTSNKELIRIKKQKKTKEKRGFWGSLRIKRPSKNEVVFHSLTLSRLVFFSFSSTVTIHESSRILTLASEFFRNIRINRRRTNKSTGQNRQSRTFSFHIS
jgi:hypothetical protein